MSEPTLYRYDAINGHPEDIDVAVFRSDGTLIGLFVPVEPCEHGNWNSHIIPGSRTRCHPAWIGDTDE